MTTAAHTALTTIEADLRAHWNPAHLADLRALMQVAALEDDALLRIVPGGARLVLYANHAAYVMSTDLRYVHLGADGPVDITQAQARAFAATRPRLITIRRMAEDAFLLDDGARRRRFTVGAADSAVLGAPHRFHDPAAAHARQQLAVRLLDAASP